MKAHPPTKGSPMSKSKPKRPSTALTRRPVTLPSGANSSVGMFERLSRDKGVDAGKLERLIAMQKDILRVEAERAFNLAYTAMVLTIPEIDRKGKITNKDGAIQSRYSRHEDIQRVVKPLLQQHGFALSYRSEWPEPGRVRVVGMLTHQDGHHRESMFESIADTSGNKNAIQALGSAVSYGRRYTTIDLLNITCVGVDDDGQATAKGARRPPQVRTPPRREPAGGTNNRADEPITEAQLKRLWAIYRKTGRVDTELKMYLKVAYGLDHTKDIPRKDYEDIVSAIEHPGPLAPSREAGEEG